MAAISCVLGIISLALCWVPIGGLVVSVMCVIGCALLKRKREYGKNKMSMKTMALFMAIAGLVISIFVTGLNVTKNTIVAKTNEGALNDVRSSFNSAILLQAQQKASIAWNEARMRGLKNEKMEQYIFDALESDGIDIANIDLEIVKTGVTVKIK